MLWCLLCYGVCCVRVLAYVMVLVVRRSYGVSLCYGVCSVMVLACVVVLALLRCWLCYGVCPCHGVNP